MEWVQHYASVDERKHLEPGVAGERYKPVYSVDRALVKHFAEICQRFHNTVFTVFKSRPLVL